MGDWILTAPWALETFLELETFLRSETHLRLEYLGLEGLGRQRNNNHTRTQNSGLSHPLLPHQGYLLTRGLLSSS